MEFKIEDINKHVVASDTDSIFIGLESILRKLHPDIDYSNKEIVLPIVKKYQKLIEKKINPYQSVIAKSILNSDKHYFDLKSEFIIERAYWSGKRRYAQKVVDKEGIPVDELIIMGLNFMKSDMNPLYKKFGEEMIRKIMYGAKKQEIDKLVKDFIKFIKVQPLENIAKPTGVKNINLYIERKPGVGEIFSVLKTGTPINSKSAIATNDLLRFKKLDKQYSCIVDGDKIKYIQLKNNPFKLDVIAIRGGKEDPPFLKEFAEQYADRDLGLETALMNKLRGIYSDIGWEFVDLRENAGRFFKFE